jgi:predicted dehydrogenase
MRHFVDHFEAGTAPLETFLDGVIVNTILDACYRSMRSGTWEDVTYPS